MNILIDTSVIIDDLRQSHLKTKTILNSLYESHEKMYFSSITIGEIYSGSSAVSMEKKINRVLSLMEMVDINTEILKSAGAVRRKTHISLIDAIIAATAIELNIPIATLNVKDFEKVKNIKLFDI